MFDLREEIRENFDNALAETINGWVVTTELIDGNGDAIAVFVERADDGYTVWDNHKALLELQNLGFDLKNILTIFESVCRTEGLTFEGHTIAAKKVPEEAVLTAVLLVANAVKAALAIGDWEKSQRENASLVAA